MVGGSLGGLLAANLLHRAGHDVVVLERATALLDGRGAGIVTHPALLEALRRAGVETQNRERAASGADLGIAVQSRVALNARGEVTARLNLPQVLTSWSRLYAMLKAALPAERYLTGIDVEAVTQTASGAVVHAAGQTFDASLVIASDGLRSTLRRQFAPNALPLYAGYVAWRGVCDESALSGLTLATLFDHFGFGLPDGEQIIGYPVTGANNQSSRGQRRYNFVWYRPAHSDAALATLLTDADGVHYPQGIPPHKIDQRHIRSMRNAAKEWLAPQFAEITEKTVQPFLQPIFDVSSPRIAFGRVALMGDASFVARPHVGMGVTKAAKDAMALVECINTAGATSGALARYEALRLAPGNAVVNRGRALGRYLQTYNPADSLATARDIQQVLRDTAVDPEDSANVDVIELAAQGG